MENLEKTTANQRKTMENLGRAYGKPMNTYGTHKKNKGKPTEHYRKRGTQDHRWFSLSLLQVFLNKSSPAFAVENCSKELSKPF